MQWVITFKSTLFYIQLALTEDIQIIRQEKLAAHGRYCQDIKIFSFNDVSAVLLFLGYGGLDSPAASGPLSLKPELSKSRYAGMVMELNNIVYRQPVPFLGSWHFLVH